jgi:hypothetical protein
MLTNLRVMSGDPIPDKSSQLFVPQIDVWGPDSRRTGGTANADRLPDTFTYRDAVAFMRAHRGVHQTAIYGMGLDLDAGSGRPFAAAGLAAYADFFPLFEVPFASGGPWSAADDEKAWTEVAAMLNVVMRNVIAMSQPSMLLQLEIESFYVFSKIVLDRAANFVHW